MIHNIDALDRKRKFLAAQEAAANAHYRDKEIESRGSDDDALVQPRTKKKKVPGESGSSYAALRTCSSPRFAAVDQAPSAHAAKKGRPVMKSEVYTTTRKDWYHKPQPEKHRIYLFAVAGGSRDEPSSGQGPLEVKEGRGKEC